MSVRFVVEVADESGDEVDLPLRNLKWLQTGSKAGGFDRCWKLMPVRRFRCDGLVRFSFSMSFSLVAECRSEESSARVCHIVCGDGVWDRTPRRD
jgi:hypothetical protein